MSSAKALTYMCQFDWGVFWSAISAVATAAAVIVALCLARQQGMEAKRERAEEARLAIVQKLEFVCSVARYAQSIYGHALEEFEGDNAESFCRSANLDVYTDTEFAVRDMPVGGLPSGELVVVMHRLKMNFGIAAAQAVALIEMGRVRGALDVGSRLTGAGAEEAKDKLHTALMANNVLISKFENELRRYSDRSN